MPERTLTVSLPTDELAAAVGPKAGVKFVLWDMREPASRDAFDIVVAPYLESPTVLRRLEGLSIGLVQSQSIGFDSVAESLPSGIPFANASTVHETSTAELAVAHILTLQRGLADFVRASQRREWAFDWYQSLADRHVLIVGFGAVGRALEQRLAGFEVDITRVARTARVEASPSGRPVQVHGMHDLRVLTRHADIVVLTVPLSAETRHLVDAEFLSGMKDGAMLVNVARGPVVDTDALVREVVSGRLRAALDVLDPEPLPAEHPLWELPNVLISPHVGGASSAMLPRMTSLIHRQIDRMLAGEPPLNVVLNG